MEKLKKGFEILNQLHKYHYQAYIVGGAVRDYLLGIQPEDIDIATSARVTDLQKIFSSVDISAQKYESVRILLEDTVFEVTTFRKDIAYEDHRHPQVAYVQTIEEDLKRRDFTMNAMAMNTSFEIIDLFGGKEDLKNRVVKVVGNPEERFEEDGLRVLRAVYFCSKLDFQLDESIIKVIQAKDYLKELPKEYIQEMLEKILSMPFSIGIKYIVEYEILRSFPFYQRLAELGRKYTTNVEDLYVLYYCLYGAFPEDESVSKLRRKRAEKLSGMVVRSFDRISLYESCGEGIDEAVCIYNLFHQEKKNGMDVHRLYDDLPIHHPKDIGINIQHVKEPELRSKVFKEIERAILQNEITNEKEIIIDFIKKWGCSYEN